jgi:hypothetical protein
VKSVAKIFPKMNASDRKQTKEIKVASSMRRLRSLWQNLLLLVLTALLTSSASAQIQQAWVAHYNNGITNGTNQAVKMALDSAGNIYVTGFSQNTNSQLGYVTIKYAPNGNQLWATRYDSSNSAPATPAAICLDVSNDVIVTGSTLTVKYDSNGNQLWTLPYAGTALAVDSNANVYVAGFQDFGTVKVAPQGTNVWITTYIDPAGPTVSQSVLVDSGNNVYVSGLDTYYYQAGMGPPGGPYVTLTSIKYGSNGNLIWKTSEAQGYCPGVQVGGAALDSSNNLYLVSAWAFPSDIYEYVTSKYASDGTEVWTAYPASGNLNNTAYALSLNSSMDVLLTGVIYIHLGSPYSTSNYVCYGTVELNTNGLTVWNNLYPQYSSGASVGTALAVDSANNCYVTGYSPGTNSLNDIVTIKYGPSGNQIWLERYNGPGNGNAAGNAIAVDNNGNVYVTGYDTTTAGGTEMVLIKYSPLVLQMQTNGSILLQAQGYAGESFDIQASEDLSHWLDLGIVTADTNGLMQFDDTNAPNYPTRFYYTNPQ